jgi:Na+/H+-dicarboxylate symporter
MIPLIIVGLVAPAIADIGSKVGRLLLWAVGLAYVDTILAGLLGYGVGSWLFPQMVEAGQNTTLTTEAEALLPFFEIKIPPLFDVMAALVLSFVAGLSIAYCHAPTLKQGLCEMRKLVEIIIQAAIIPLLPLYIFGIFLEMTFTGSAYHILLVFAKIIVVIFVLHITVLLYEFVIAGGLTHRNPLKLLWTMLPAYFMALGTSSSAATIPVTLRQTKKNGVSEDVASFAVPLCATIHMSGSMMKITCCALTVCLMSGLPYDFPLFLHFMMLLGVCMVAGPGVPGGAIMAALGPLASILGFSPDQQALMIALYIAMDSFGTACNVTGDGAIALVLDKLFRK